MLIALIRSILLFLLVVLALRIMGKRQVGQLQPYEMVMVIMFSALASIPMSNIDIPLIYAIVPIISLVFLQSLISFLTLKSSKARSIICGMPTILIENGKIQEKQLRRLRYNLNELLEQLRTQQVAEIGDVEFAILENSGQVTVIPKSQKRPVTPADLQIPTQYEGLSTDLIIDGEVQKQNLQKIKLSEAWLQNQLQSFNISAPEQVLFATLSTQKQFYFQLKEKYQKQRVG